MPSISVIIQCSLSYGYAMSAIMCTQYVIVGLSKSSLQLLQSIVYTHLKSADKMSKSCTIIITLLNSVISVDGNMSRRDKTTDIFFKTEMLNRYANISYINRILRIEILYLYIYSQFYTNTSNLKCSSHLAILQRLCSQKSTCIAISYSQSFF